MNRQEQTVRFMCPRCDKRLKSKARNAGRRCRCPECSIPMEIPAQSRALAVRPVVYPVAAAPRQEQVTIPAPVPYPVVAPPAPQGQATVPFNIALPQDLGGIQTTVSQNTADNLASVVTGGLLVALGVAVAAFFGIRRPSA